MILEQFISFFFSSKKSKSFQSFDDNFHVTKTSFKNRFDKEKIKEVSNKLYRTGSNTIIKNRKLSVALTYTHVKAYHTRLTAFLLG